VAGCESADSSEDLKFPGGAAAGAAFAGEAATSKPAGSRTAAVAAISRAGKKRGEYCMVAVPSDSN
jgi:hypothetical protein